MKMNPSSSCTAATSKTFVTTHLQISSGKLTSECEKWLADLGVTAKDFPSVNNELFDIYHETGKIMHYYLPDGYRNTGLLIGGSFPLRAAVSLVLLKLQQLKHLPLVDIKYGEDDFNPIFLLTQGRITKI